MVNTFTENERNPRKSALYENAIDSLRIGMEFFLKETGYPTRKHAILTVFYSIELLLKERLARTNPILIYKNIDVKITDDAQTLESVRKH